LNILVKFHLDRRGQNKKQPKKIHPARVNLFWPISTKIPKMTKTAKISKEIFKYLRDNENEAKQVVKLKEQRLSVSSKLIL
jgi:hypothetical protein